MDGIGATRVLEVDIDIRHEGCIVSECLTDGAMATQVSADRDADVLVMHGPTEAHVDRFVRNVFATQDAPPTILLRAPTSVVIKGRNPEWGVVSTLVSAGATILWPATWSDGHERYTLVVSDRDALTALLDATKELGAVEVTRMVEVDAGDLGVSLPLSTLVEGLTARQLDALRLAVNEGYYEMPRRTSTAALSKTSHVSRTTFEEHLRKAERIAVARFASLVAAHPALATSSLKPRGRPKKRPSATGNAGPRRA